MVRMGNGMEELQIQLAAQGEVISPEVARVRDINRRISIALARMIGANREKIMSAADGFGEVLKLGVECFISHAEIDGWDRIPADENIVIAFGHPSSVVDSTVLMERISSVSPQRPWAMVAQFFNLARNCPELVADGGFAKHMISVDRRGSKVVNKDEILGKSITLLRGNGNAALFIAPAAPEDAQFAPLTDIPRPHRGFAVIAREVRARIVPVLGQLVAVDAEALRFDTKYTVLPPFEPFEDDAQTRLEWQKRMQEALRGMSSPL
ncbi:hypothetical protein HZA42_04820 [Candidatus Peregrinibacteria bacterium]|nr:hypothetical protein [Candidatus Peregrinibacteria bacterium]